VVHLNTEVKATRKDNDLAETPDEICKTPVPDLKMLPLMQRFSLTNDIYKTVSTVLKKHGCPNAVLKKPLKVEIMKMEL